MSTLLASMLHISDLHLGILNPATGDAAMSALEVFALKHLPQADGLLGHRGQALQDLAVLIQSLQEADENFRLVVTGDLTRYGDYDELALARKFLEQEIDLNPPAKNYVGLYASDQLQAIPGNHDHWAGSKLPIGATPSIYYHHFFNDIPGISELPLGGSGQSLRLLHVDSDHGVPANSIQRLLARGSFGDQLERLDSLLDDMAEGGLCALLVHHPVAWPGFILALTGRAGTQLVQFLDKHHIGVVLSGHTHKPDIRFHTVGGHVIREFGAGSTAQIDATRYKHKQALGLPATSKPPTQLNSLFIHRLFDHLGDLVWEATLVHSSPLARGFNKQVSRIRFQLN